MLGLPNSSTLTSALTFLELKGQQHLKTIGMKLTAVQYRRAHVSHQWSPPHTVEVVEEALGVVDCWTEDRVWFTPLTIQILTIQITAVP